MKYIYPCGSFWMVGACTPSVRTYVATVKIAVMYNVSKRPRGVAYRCSGKYACMLACRIRVVCVSYACEIAVTVYSTNTFLNFSLGLQV